MNMEDKVYNPFLLLMRPVTTEFVPYELIPIREEMTIGRDLNCTFVVRSLVISRVHCVIRKTENKCQIIDRSSVGIRINDNKSSKDPIELKNNDLLRFDIEARFLFKFIELYEDPTEKTKNQINEINGSLFNANLNVQPPKRKSIDTVEILTDAFQIKAEIALKNLEQRFQKEMEDLEGPEEVVLVERLRLLQTKIDELVELQHQITEEQLLSKNTYEALLKEHEDLIRLLNLTRDVIQNQEGNPKCDNMFLARKRSHAKLIEQQLRVNAKSLQNVTAQCTSLDVQNKNVTEMLNESRKAQSNGVLDLRSIISGETNKRTPTPPPEMPNAIEQLIEDELQCPICSEMFVMATTLNCSHSFCFHCITEWVKRNNQCPICRDTISTQCPSLVLNTFIEKIVQKMHTDVITNRKTLVANREKKIQLEQKKKERAKKKGGRRKRRRCK